MSRIAQAIITLLLISALVPQALAKDKHEESLKNQSENHFWIVRGDKTEPKNKSGDIAYVVKVSDVAGVLVARLWAYNHIDEMTKQYVFRQALTLIEDTTFDKKGTMFTYTATDGTKHSLRIVVDRRKRKKGNGKWDYKPRLYDRVVMRYTVTDPKEKDDCPPVPEDEVLEEEEMPEDYDPEMDPPEYPDIPAP